MERGIWYQSRRRSTGSDRRAPSLLIQRTCDAVRKLCCPESDISLRRLPWPALGCRKRLRRRSIGTFPFSESASACNGCSPEAKKPLEHPASAFFPATASDFLRL